MSRCLRRWSVLGAAALVAWLHVGCGKPVQHFTMVFDPCDPVVLVPENATAEEVASIEDAIAMWQAVIAPNFTLAELPDARRLPVRVEEANWYMGRFDDQEGVIWLARRVNRPHARAVVIAHELGHAMGLYHVDPDERRSVMSSGNIEITPTPSDAAALEHMWGECVLRSAP